MRSFSTTWNADGLSHRGGRTPTRGATASRSASVPPLLVDAASGGDAASPASTDPPSDIRFPPGPPAQLLPPMPLAPPCCMPGAVAPPAPPRAASWCCERQTSVLPSAPTSVSGPSRLSHCTRRVGADTVVSCTRGGTGGRPAAGEGRPGAPGLAAGELAAG